MRRISRRIAEWFGLTLICIALLAINAHNDAKPYSKELTTTFCPGKPQGPFGLRLYRAYSVQCRLTEPASRT